MAIRNPTTPGKPSRKPAKSVIEASPDAPMPVVSTDAAVVLPLSATLPVAAKKPVKPAPVKTPMPVTAPTPVAAPVARLDPPMPAAPAAPVIKAPAPAPAPVSVAAITPAAPPAAVSAQPQPEEPIMETIENATTKTQAMFSDVNDRAKGAMEKSAKMAEELTAFGKGNIEAIVESSKIAAKGIESIGQDAAAYAKAQFEQSTAALKTLSSVKSPTEFMQLQADLMRQSFDSLVAQTSRSTETMLKLAGEVAQPLSNRMAVAAEKIKVTA